MEITIEIPEKKAPFVLELLRNLKFLKIKQPVSELGGFRERWNSLSMQLPQNDPDITQEEIMAEIRAARTERNINQHPG